MSATKALAEYAAGMQYENLPNEVIAAAKHCLLDFLGVAYAGSMESPSLIMKETCEKIMGGSGCRLLTTGFPEAGLLQAAMCNAAFGHALDMDDVHNGSIIHLAAVTIPAALALGQIRGNDGKTFITAIVTGYEVGARIGLAVNPSSYFFWHTTATVGNFSAAAACSRLLSLTPGQTLHAFGSAGTQAGGLWEFLADGAMSKFLHCGKACMNGIIAAELARNGYTAATRILEGEKGFIRAMAPQPDFDMLTKDLGKSFMILENSYKPYPCCKHTHPSIYAVLEIMEKSGVRFDDVENVTARVYAVAKDLVGNQDPQTSYGCKFSLPYCVSAALFFGEVGTKHFSEEYFNHPKLRSMLERIHVVVDEAMETIFRNNPHQWAQQIEIRTRSGETFIERVDYPKGDPENPLSFNERVTKFNRLTTDILSEDERNYIIDRISDLEKVKDLAELFPTPPLP